MVPILVVFGVFLLFSIFYAILTYNGLVAKKNQVENVFASADAFLKKRRDLIPNLVAWVKNYADHESRMLTEVAGLRSNAGVAGLADDDKVVPDPPGVFLRDHRPLDHSGGRRSDLPVRRQACRRDQMDFFLPPCLSGRDHGVHDSFYDFRPRLRQSL